MEGWAPIRVDSIPAVLCGGWARIGDLTHLGLYAGEKGHLSGKSSRMCANVCVCVCVCAHTCLAMLIYLSVCAMPNCGSLAFSPHDAVASN